MPNEKHVTKVYKNLLIPKERRQYDLILTKYQVYMLFSGGLCA